MTLTLKDSEIKAAFQYRFLSSQKLIKSVDHSHKAIKLKMNSLLVKQIPTIGVSKNHQQTQSFPHEKSMYCRKNWRGINESTLVRRTTLVPSTVRV